MDKYKLLSDRAKSFQVMLERYAKTDKDVADFLQRILPWFQRIEHGEIVLPCYDYKLSIYFSNPDLSSLAERYGFTGHELGEACSAFSEAIYDWLSDPGYVKRLEDFHD